MMKKTIRMLEGVLEMKRRSLMPLFGMLLLAALLLALSPAAFAEGRHNGCPMSCQQPGRDDNGRRQPPQDRNNCPGAADDENRPAPAGKNRPGERFYSQAFGQEMTPDEFMLALDAWLAGQMTGKAEAAAAVMSEAPGTPEEAEPTEDAAIPEEAEPPEDAGYDFYLGSWETLESWLTGLVTELREREGQELGPVTLHNPWTETDSLDEAKRISGVPFDAPAADALPQGMELLYYRAMARTLEADYSDGEEQLMIRASADMEGFPLAGDYNSYTHSWQMEFDGLTVDCLGDGERANVAVFRVGELGYAVSTAPGREGEGLDAEALRTLLTGMRLLPSFALPEDTDSGEEGSEIVILFTGNVHSAVDAGFGYVGLYALRDTLEAKGCATVLADCGNALQGAPLGTVSRGEAIVDLMNALRYDVALIGQDELDLGEAQLDKLAAAADFPFLGRGEEYTMVEAAGKKLAFIGAAEAKNDWQRVQSAADSARKAGADYVFVLSSSADCEALASRTTGIDAFLDGQSRGSGQRVLKNSDGQPVPCVACGEKLSFVGCIRIAAEGGAPEPGGWSWTNGDMSAPALLGIENEISEMVSASLDRLNRELGANAA